VGHELSDAPIDVIKWVLPKFLVNDPVIFDLADRHRPSIAPICFNAQNGPETKISIVSQ
jgi:hypothetical protein